MVGRDYMSSTKWWLELKLLLNPRGDRVLGEMYAPTVGWISLNAAMLRRLRRCGQPADFADDFEYMKMRLEDALLAEGGSDGAKEGL